MVPTPLIGRVIAAEKDRRGTWASDPAGPGQGQETEDEGGQSQRPICLVGQIHTLFPSET